METTRRKILYTASTDGHLRSFHLPYLKALAEDGWAVTAAAAGDGRGLPEGVDFVSVPFTKSFVSPDNFRAAAAIAGLIRKERFDVILTHTSLAAFFTRLGVRLAGKRNAVVINTVHGYLFDDMSSPMRRAVMLGAEKLMAGVTDAVLTMNEADHTIAEKNRLAHKVIPIDGMGVPLKKFAPPAPVERAEARQSLSIAEDALVLLYAAEFSERKNQKFLVEALPQLPENAVLLLPGTGALREDCREAAMALQVSGRVILPGFVQDMTPYLHAADVCISSSRSEGLPFHVMEAMSCGLPSVLTRVKGHEDLLRGEKAGLLFPFDDRDAFVKAVRRLADDPALRQKMGDAARESVQRYSLDQVKPTLLPLFRGEG